MEGETETIVMAAVKDPEGIGGDRLLRLDLDDVDDWGDIEVGKNEDGEAWAEVGIEEGLRWSISEAWVATDAELHQGKYTMAKRISLEELHDLVMKRMERFSN